MKPYEIWKTRCGEKVQVTVSRPNLVVVEVLESDCLTKGSTYTVSSTGRMISDKTKTKHDLVSLLSAAPRRNPESAFPPVEDPPGPHHDVTCGYGIDSALSETKDDG